MRRGRCHTCCGSRNGQRIGPVHKTLVKLCDKHLVDLLFALHCERGKFIALFRNTSSEKISEIAARVQASISFHRPGAASSEDICLGISIGQAQLKKDGTTLEELLDEADRRLHTNKAALDSFQTFANTGDAMMTGAY